MYVPVNFLLRNKKTLSGVEGVMIHVYSKDLKTLHFAQITDSEGAAGALLFSPNEYEIRCHAPGYRQNPCLLTLDEEGPIEVVLDLEIVSPEDSNDPSLCNVYDKFSSLDGPVKGVIFCSLAEGVAVRGDRVYVASPVHGAIENGYYQKEFPRGARILFGVPNMEPFVEVTIPDAPRARLTDLMAPYVTKVVWETPPPTTLEPGEEVTLPYTQVLSDERAGSSDLLVWTSSSDNLLVEASHFELRIRALRSGVSQIVGKERIHNEILPKAPFLNRGLDVEGASFQVTVPLAMDQDIRCIQALARMIFYRAVYDWKLYRSSGKKGYRKEAGQAYRWLFLEEDAVVPLGFVCEVLGILPIDARSWARSVSLEDISSLYRGGRLKDASQGHAGKAHVGSGRRKARSHREDSFSEDGEVEEPLRGLRGRGGRRGDCPAARHFLPRRSHALLRPPPERLLPPGRGRGGAPGDVPEAAGPPDPSGSSAPQPELHPSPADPPADQAQHSAQLPSFSELVEGDREGAGATLHPGPEVREKARGGHASGPRPSGCGRRPCPEG